MAYLGVKPGSVTAFGVINDLDGAVSMVLDQSLLNGQIINAHPLRNDMTTAISPDDLLKFLAAESHSPLILNFDRLGEDAPA
jgi:Ala-tRNA(Pro) deacylase